MTISSQIKKWMFIPAIALLLGCALGGRGTAIPAGLPASFDVQTSTPAPDLSHATPTRPPVEPEVEIILPLGDAPTNTPDPNATPTPVVQPTATPIPILPTPSVPAVITPTATVTPTKVTVAVPTPVVEPDPPLKGGNWDFEAEFIPWANPYGEPCPGAAVASGWTAFVEKGEYGSSCMNENLYQPNVFTGLKSQEITFDFIAANSGVYRTIPTRPGHQYTIATYGKHDHSTTPVQLFLGVDVTGGAIWNAETVEWFPWDGSAEDTWLPTEETVTATGESMTIFIRGFHPLAEQGGKTVVDNVSITDLGL